MACILVADQHYATRRWLREPLEQAGHHVIEALQGNEVLLYWPQPGEWPADMPPPLPPAVIVVGPHLSDMPTTALVGELRRRQQPVPVLLIVEGADALLTGPVSSPDLIATVDRLLTLSEDS